jgi:phosphoglycerate dehydrogenase-like enzyme
MRVVQDDGAVVVAVLYPPGFDAGRLTSAVAGSNRTIEVIVAPYEEDPALRLAKRDGVDIDELRAVAPPLSAETTDAVAKAEVILALDVPVDLLALAPRLRWIQAIGAGVRQFDETALAARGVRLTTAAGVGAPPIAEFVMGRVLEVWKGFRRLEDMQRRQVWQFTPGRMLAGSTIGIVGLGAIGSAVAQLARAFGMRVVATRRRFTPGATSPLADELSGPEGLEHLLSTSDVVVLAAPETAQTESMIGEAELALMKRGSVLCNVARGALVDEAALMAALDSGHLAAAILDVTKTEPLPSGSPLWTAPNIYLSPHSATSTDGYFDRLSDLFGANMVRYLRGDALHNLVNPDAGY